MHYLLTTSQKNFYIDESFVDIPLWNEGCIILFPVNYSYEQLNNAFNCFVEHHEHFRMLIDSSSKEVTSYIATFHPIQYPFYPFSSTEELFYFAQDYVNKPFNYQEELFRCILVSTPEHTGFFSCIHHILIDGFCSQIMAEFLEYYLLNGHAPNHTLQSYQEHVTNEHQYPETMRYQKDIAYWNEVLSSDVQYSVFQDKVTGTDYSCQEYRTTTSEAFFQKIERFCKDHKLNPSTLFYTALAGYLHREYHHSNFTIGMPVLNRTSHAEMNTFGLYMHVLPLKIQISEDDFLTNAQSIEREKFKLLRHSKLTQEQIQNDYSSLFDVLLNYQPLSEEKNYELFYICSNALSLPMEIHVHTLRKKEYQIIIRYRKSCFEHTEIEQMWSRMVHFIENAIADPTTEMSKISQYDLSWKDRQELLIHYNQTDFNYHLPQAETLYSLFEKSVIKSPDANCFFSDQYTYRFKEFHHLTTALDCKIQTITQGTKSVIAIIADRSLEMYASIYAAIRGGNAYLPISPEDPLERIHFLLKDSGTALILAQDSYTQLDIDIPVVNITEFINSGYTDASYHQTDIFLSYAVPEDTAYVIYTSGSTGKPKGVKINHRSLINRILWMQECYPVDQNSVILQKTPYTFDVSLWEIFWWGICGCSMTPSKPKEHFLPSKILNTVEKYQVTHLHFVPSVFDIFLTYLENHKEKLLCFTTVKHVFLSGETLAASLIQRFYALFSYPDVQLHNLYGPTECTVDVTYYDCTPDDTDPVPIGKPIYNTSTYILDSGLELLPKGMIGELCIGGINVGQGYLNNPELTDEKFVSNPFGVGTLYRTGDYVRFREDGQILFCGRMDGQKKLNGQRIELGEIENILTQIDEVESAAADIRSLQGQESLAVYYCGSVDEETVRNYCQRKLPPYMVPAHIFHLNQMPLTSNGKLDRKILSALEYADDHPLEEMPQNQEERFAFDLFRRILKTDAIGRHSNFFSLGGTSLSMIELLSEKPFTNVTVSDFMKDPTPVGLVRCARQYNANKFRKLSCIRDAECAQKAFILFPYAGGGAESFTELKLSADQSTIDFAIYYTDYPKNIAECELIAQELEILSKNYELYFYSHCAGSAAALKVIQLLEERNLSIVKHYLAGGNIPSRIPAKESLWKQVPDPMLLDILTKAGASLKTLSNAHIQAMVNKFRQDTDFYTEHFYQTSPKIHCPFSLVLSKQDLFTENYFEAEEIWNQYVEAIQKVYYIDDPSHYFLSTSANSLVSILIKIIENEC